MEDQSNIVALMCRIIGRRMDGFIGVECKHGDKCSEFSLTFLHGTYNYSVPTRHLKSRTPFSVAKGLFCNAENDRIVRMLPVLNLILGRLKHGTRN